MAVLTEGDRTRARVYNMSLLTEGDRADVSLYKHEPPDGGRSHPRTSLHGPAGDDRTHAGLHGLLRARRFPGRFPLLGEAFSLKFSCQLVVFQGSGDLDRFVLLKLGSEIQFAIGP